MRYLLLIQHGDIVRDSQSQQSQRRRRLLRALFMCDDLRAEIQTLESKGVPCAAVEEARWGSVTKINLPGGGRLGLYQPKHPSPVRPPQPDHAGTPPRSAPLTSASS